MDENLFLIGQVIHETARDKDYRILWTADSQEDPSYWICINSKRNTPEPVFLKLLAEGIRSGKYSFAPDTWKPVHADQVGTTALQLRDHAWCLIKEAVGKEPDIYQKDKRGAILKSIERATGTSTTNLYKHLGKYWKYGKVPDALLPDYSLCGKTRDPYKASSKRPGKKKIPGAAGKKLVAEDLRHFSSAITRYYLNGEKRSLEAVYTKLLEDYYTVKDADGNSVAPMDPDEIPSRQQFFYWHRKNRDILKEAVKRDGERKYRLGNRGETGRTETHLYGPGIAAQIDATIADIYLVSRYDRTAIIGRPTMYFQMDSFSRMVTGMSISLDPPSMMNAAGTILNSVENKVEFCRKYGITITEDEWPCMHFPSIILADRGEMESGMADILSNHLGITVENAPPYRGDLKGIIEKHFDLVNLDMAGLPGKMQKDAGQRCTHDYRLDACLDLDQFTAIIIRCVLQYNNYHYMEDYRRSSQMRQLHVKPIPRDIWNFGIRYRSGGLRTVDREYARYYLLPKGEASVTREGILYKGRYYTCEQAEQEKWFDIARTEASWKVTVSYDPRDAALIYISPTAGEAPLECHLLEKDSIYSGRSVHEADRMAAADSEEKAVWDVTEDFHRVQLDEYIERVKREARDQQPDRIAKSKAARIAEIDENRRKEREQIKKRNTEETMKSIRGVSAVPGPEGNNGGMPAESKAAEPVDPMTERLRKALEQRLRKGDGTDGENNPPGALP